MSFDHRLVVTRVVGATETVIYDGKADLQDASFASTPRGFTGTPPQELEVPVFLADEEAGIGIAPHDVATVHYADGRTKFGEVTVYRELDGAALVKLDEYGLTHTVIIERRIETRLPGARIQVTWAAEPPVAGRLTPVGGLTDAERGDKPVAEGEWVLTLDSTVVNVREGDRAIVKGHQGDVRTNPVTWNHMVLITKVMPPTRANDRRQSLLATDWTDWDRD